MYEIDPSNPGFQTVDPMRGTAQRTADLWLKIDQHHLNYLKAEDGPKKLSIRKKLEGKYFVDIFYNILTTVTGFLPISGFIQQYLNLVPQDRKFCNSLTNDVLFESARWVPNFSALKASQAFEALETYAANLLNQPWRKEFKEIKVT